MLICCAFQEISSTSLHPASSLVNHVSWPKITCLIALLRVRLLQPSAISEISIAMPDIAYAVLMTAGLGGVEIRTQVQSLLVAALRAVIASSERVVDDKIRTRDRYLHRLQNLAIFQKSDPKHSHRAENHFDMLRRIEEFWTVLLQTLSWTAQNTG